MPLRPWRPYSLSSLRSPVWRSGRTLLGARSVTELGRLLGPTGGDFINSILARSSDPTSGATATAVGIVTVLVTASGVFGEMRTALNATFKAKPTDEPIFSLIRSRAASLGLVAALGFMLIVSLAASAGLSALEQWSAGKVVLSALNTVVSLGIFTLLFAAIYRVLPDTTIYWRHLLLGAFVTAAAVHRRKIADRMVPRSGSARTRPMAPRVR